MTSYKTWLKTAKIFCHSQLFLIRNFFTHVQWLRRKTISPLFCSLFFYIRCGLCCDFLDTLRLFSYVATYLGRAPGQANDYALWAPNPLCSSTHYQMFYQDFAPPNRSGPQVFCPPALSPALLRTTDTLHQLRPIGVPLA